MSEPAQLSVQLQVQGRNCVVVGGGAVAARRTRRLLEAGAQVRVIAPALHQDFDELAASELLRIERRVFEPADLDPIAAAGNTPPQQVLLVIVATNDPTDLMLDCLQHRRLQWSLSPSAASPESSSHLRVQCPLDSPGFLLRRTRLQPDHLQRGRSWPR